jgi:hypothetical protein
MDPFGIPCWDSNTKMLLRELEVSGTGCILTTYSVVMLIQKFYSENSREVRLRGSLRHTLLGF